MFNIFEHLKSHLNSKLVMNPVPMYLGLKFASIFQDGTKRCEFYEDIE